MARSMRIIEFLYKVFNPSKILILVVAVLMITCETAQPYSALAGSDCITAYPIHTSSIGFTPRADGAYYYSNFRSLYIVGDVKKSCLNCKLKVIRKEYILKNPTAYLAIEQPARQCSKPNCRAYTFWFEGDSPIEVRVKVDLATKVDVVTYAGPPISNKNKEGYDQCLSFVQRARNSLDN